MTKHEPRSGLAIRVTGGYARTLSEKMFNHPSSKRWRESLVEDGSTDGGWTRFFVDPKTQIRWVEYFPYDDDRSPAHLRERDIPSDPVTLLDQCLGSSKRDEWIGIAAYMSNAFDTKHVLQALESTAPNFRKKALKVFGKNYLPKDNRQIIGKHHTEIELSYREHLEAIRKINELTHNG